MTTEDLLLLADQYRDSGSPAARSVLAAKLDALCAELASANRECEVRNERELGYLARAQSAEAELAQANALLREARDWLDSGRHDVAGSDCMTCERVARIDAHLGGEHG